MLKGKLIKCNTQLPRRKCLCAAQIAQIQAENWQQSQVRKLYQVRGKR